MIAQPMASARRLPSSTGASAGGLNRSTATASAMMMPRASAIRVTCFGSARAHRGSPTLPSVRVPAMATMGMMRAGVKTALPLLRRLASRSPTEVVLGDPSPMAVAPRTVSASTSIPLARSPRLRAEEKAHGEQAPEGGIAEALAVGSIAEPAHRDAGEHRTREPVDLFQPDQGRLSQALEPRIESPRGASHGLRTPLTPSGSPIGRASWTIEAALLQEPLDEEDRADRDEDVLAEERPDVVRGSGVSADEIAGLARSARARPPRRPRPSAQSADARSAPGRRASSGPALR